MIPTGPTGFEAQFREFMFYFGTITQVFYWIVIPIIAIWAVLIFKRAVDHHTGQCGHKHAAPYPAGHGAAQSSATDGGWKYEDDEVSDDDTAASASRRPIKTEKFVD